MATTTRSNINIKNGKLMGTPMASGATLYHGAISLVNGAGYAVNGASSVYGVRMAGIVYLSNDATTSNYITATGNGDISANTNLIQLYTEGEFDHIAFDAITQIDVGNTVWIKDNNTLTCNPANGLYPIGTLTKYISATKGEVRLNSFYNGDDLIMQGKLPAGSTDTVILGIVNPYGVDVLVKDFKVVISTAGSSAAEAIVGISTAPNTTAKNVVMTSSGITIGTTGIFTIATNFSTAALSGRDQTWAAANYLTILTTATAGSALVGYWSGKFEIA